MNHAPDAAAGNGGTFDPQQAAALLDQTTRQARRQLEPSPPWLLAIRAVLVLAAFGAIWLSVRGQHPYRGPTAADIPVLVAFIVVNFAATVAVRQRAHDRGTRDDPGLAQGEIAVLVLAFVATVVAMAGLGAAGVSFALYPTTVLIIPGLAWAAVMAARADWGNCATGLAVAVVGVVGCSPGRRGRGRSPAWACVPCSWAGPPPSRGGSAHDEAPMNDDALDPLIHVPTRLKIVATLAALPDGDTLSFTRLQDMIGLTPGNLIIHLRKLEEADYISSEKARNGTVSITTVALTGHGRKALGAYTQALRDLLGGL